MNTVLTVYQGHSSDRNGLGVPGAATVGGAFARKLSLDATVIGHPLTASRPCPDWKGALDEALPDLKELATHFERIVSEKHRLLTALPRCAVALATIATVARHHSEARIVWFDAHADLNTPQTSPTGYLGGMVLTAAAGLWDSGLGNGLNLKNLILAGVRDIDAPERNIIAENGVIALSPEETATDALRKAIGGRAVYMHIDCDVLDPGIIPTEYLCPDGLTLEQLSRACRIIAENEVIGLEIAEFQATDKEGGKPVSPEPLLNALDPVIARLGKVI